MNILLDIGHPAQVHLFKNLYHLATQRGHQVTVYGRDKDCALDLLRAANMPVAGFTRARNTFRANVLELMRREWDVLRLMRSRHIDLALGTSIPITHAGRLCGIPSYLCQEDDIDVVPLLGRVAFPFCTGIVAPRCIRMGKWAHKHIAYDGYQKLAYLHPRYFTPDPEVVKRLGLPLEEPYFLLRLTAFRAYHDRGQAGMDREQIETLLKRLRNHGRIYISAERPLAAELEPYRLAVPPHLIHQVMAFAALFIGDSQSMTTESALLGVPAFRCNTFAGRCSVIDELETRYGLVYSYPPARFAEMGERIAALIEAGSVRQEWAEKRARLLREKIDVTGWLMEFVESHGQNTMV